MFTLNAQLTAAQQLKDQTKANHEAAEAILIPRISSIKQREDYISLLKLFYGYHHPLEKKIAGFIDVKAIRFEADGKKYHPRAAFLQWQETVEGHARPWQKEELEIAENFRNFAVEY